MCIQNADTVKYSYGYLERRTSQTRDEFCLFTPKITDKLPKIGLSLPKISLAENLGLTFC